MPYPSSFTRLGVAKDAMDTYLSASVAAGATSLTVNSATGGSTTSVLYIYDGANTEVATATNLVSNTFTVPALAHAHGVGTIVISPGTVAGSTDFIPVTGLTPYDEIVWLDDTGWRGSRVMTYDQVEGPRFGQFEFAGDAFADTVGWPLFSVLGDVTFAAGSPNTHAGAVKNSGNGQPTPITYADNNGFEIRQYGACKHSEIAFAFNADGKMTYTTKALGYVSGPLSGSTSSYSALEVVPAWAINTTIGGTANVLVQEATLGIKAAQLDPIHTLDGTQDPYTFFAGAVEVDGKALFVFEDDTQYNNYFLNSKPSLDFLFTRGAGVSQERIQFHMTTCGYRTAKWTRGKHYVELDVEFKGLANTSDAGASGGRSPIKCTLGNVNTTGHYQ